MPQKFTVGTMWTITYVNHQYIADHFLLTTPSFLTCQMFVWLNFIDNIKDNLEKYGIIIDKSTTSDLS